jgi:hypothetical protein
VDKKSTNTTSKAAGSKRFLQSTSTTQADLDAEAAEDARDA